MPKEVFRIAHKVSMLADQADTAEVRLYGEIISDGPEWYRWSEEDKSAIKFDKDIKKVIEDGATKVLVRINSPGGVCTEAVAMRSILANAGFDEINIRIEGMCASAATFIATIPGAHVAIAEGSEYMIHNPWCMAYGNANDIEKVVNRLRNIEDTTRNFYAKKTGQEEELLKEWMDAETWFTAEEAVAYGFADELLTVEADENEDVLIAACATDHEYKVMQSMYNKIPEKIEKKPIDTVKKLAEIGNKTPDTNLVSTDPTKGSAKDNQIKEDTDMELENLTMEELREGNAALFQQIQQSAVAAERERLSDIDALTIPGYEEMAQEAKDNGTSAMDFQKNLVSAMKQKGDSFMQARSAETKPANEIAGGEPVNSAKSEEQEINDNANDMLKYAKEYAGINNNGMY